MGEISVEVAQELEKQYFSDVKPVTVQVVAGVKPEKTMYAMEQDIVRHVGEAVNVRSVLETVNV